jgi:hypothetical protein
MSQQQLSVLLGLLGQRRRSAELVALLTNHEAVAIQDSDSVTAPSTMVGEEGAD